MDKVHIHGLTAEAIEEVIITILKMALESLHGKMVRNMRDIGKMETNMGQELLLTLKVNQERAFGKMERE